MSPASEQAPMPAPTQPAPEVVFIGLGHMGLPMACQLVGSGPAVAGHDLSAAAQQRFSAAGGCIVADLPAALAAAQVVVTMLPANAQVEQTYLGPQGVLAHAGAGSLLLDCSTIAAPLARRLARAAAERGLAFLDAPVSGGTAGAAKGTLTFMVGGPAADVERAQAWLLRMGKAVFHAGEHGAGQVAKACNNLLLGIQMAGTAEALRLGMAQGLDAAVLSDIMSRSSGRNWVLEQYNPCPGVMAGAPASRAYEGGFSVDLMRKDLGLALEGALAADASVPMGSLARSLYDLHSKAGAGPLDFSSIFRLLAASA